MKILHPMRGHKVEGSENTGVVAGKETISFFQEKDQDERGQGARQGEFQAEGMTEQRKIGSWEWPHPFLLLCGDGSLVHCWIDDLEVSVGHPLEVSSK